LKLDQWEDKNTKDKRSRMKVVLEGFQFLGDGRGGGGSGTSSGNSEPATSPERHAPPARAASAKPPAAENMDEDVPF
jgi:single-strand DNA-binding protein